MFFFRILRQVEVFWFLYSILIVIITKKRKISALFIAFPFAYLPNATIKPESPVYSWSSTNNTLCSAIQLLATWSAYRNSWTFFYFPDIPNIMSQVTFYVSFYAIKEEMIRINHTVTAN